VPVRLRAVAGEGESGGQHGHGRRVEEQRRKGRRRGARAEGREAKTKPGRYAVYELKGGHPSTVVGMSYGQGRAEALRTLVDEAPSDEGSVAIAASALRPCIYTRATAN
jgi:hypothetical protein